MAKEKRPKIMFLIETMIVTKRVEGIRRKVGFEQCFVVDPVGNGGGLSLLWKDEVEVEIVNYSRWHVNAWVMDGELRKRWLFTGFYGHLETAKRKSSWELLQQLKPEGQVPWCVAGDFNEITCQMEKWGGKQREESQMMLFREAIETSQLYDLGYSGDRYTWSNGHSEGTFVNERLDRYPTNGRWQELFKEVKVEEVEDGSKCEKVKRLKCEVGQLLEKEDVKWKQRAKRSWFREGDRNTKYFHACASQRRRKSRIIQISDLSGRILKDQEGIEGAFKRHFEEVLSSSGPSVEKIEAGTQFINLG
ncbi:uncharacterized protein LOC121234570 [Juglans microcarpa x Juglans regia]|uniref:uncharacterized protein LOC121234570 n=1 Tax=Juglans microcarpa x Juglans regia TaxID=2249226 RepID=UPI001B7EBC24|nr:uncharacterized protein LOC121234570 [Juglans microcarpa x Juglans regia]